jgi:hypothetical protein
MSQPLSSLSFLLAGPTAIAFWLAIPVENSVPGVLRSGAERLMLKEAP